MKNKKKKKIKTRNYFAIAAHFRSGGPMENKKGKIKHKNKMEDENNSDLIPPQMFQLWRTCS